MCVCKAWELFCIGGDCIGPGVWSLAVVNSSSSHIESPTRLTHTSQIWNFWNLGKKWKCHLYGRFILLGSHSLCLLLFRRCLCNPWRVVQRVARRQKKRRTWLCASGASAAGWLTRCTLELAFTFRSARKLVARSARDSGTLRRSS